MHPTRDSWLTAIQETYPRKRLAAPAKIPVVMRRGLAAPHHHRCTACACL